MHGLAYYVIIQHTCIHAESEQRLSTHKKQTKTHFTQPLAIKTQTLKNEHVILYLCQAWRGFYFTISHCCNVQFTKPFFTKAKVMSWENKKVYKCVLQNFKVKKVYRFPKLYLFAGGGDNQGHLRKMSVPE